MPEHAPAIMSAPESMSENPIFDGTRLLFQMLLDYEAGQTLFDSWRTFRPCL